MSLIDRALPFSTMKSLVTPGEPDDRLDRHDGRLGLGVGDDRGLGESAGPEQPALVGDHGLDLERPAGGVDRRVDPRDLALDRRLRDGPGW